MQNNIYNDTYGEPGESNRIPIHGSMTRPGSPADGLAEMKQGRLIWTGGRLSVTVSTDEFTSTCPTTGQPDFNQVTIEYVPDRFYLESKTIKFYLWSYREHGAHCEKLADRICRDVRRAVDPHSVVVTVNQNPRGGLRIVSRAEYRKGDAAAVVPAFD